MSRPMQMASWKQLPRKAISSLLLSLFVLSACGSSEAVAFNDSLVSKQKAIQEKVTPLMAKITDLKSADAQKEINDASAFIDAKIAEVQAMPDGDKGAEFKAAVVESFTFYKRVVAQDVPNMIKIPAGEGDATAKLARIQEFEQTVKADEEKLDAAVAKAQKDYAEANNMQVAQ